MKIYNKFNTGDSTKLSVDDVDEEDEYNYRIIQRSVCKESYWIEDFKPWDIDTLEMLDVLIENWPAR